MPTIDEEHAAYSAGRADAIANRKRTWRRAAMEAPEYYLKGYEWGDKLRTMAWELVYKMDCEEQE